MVEAYCLRKEKNKEIKMLLFLLLFILALIIACGNNSNPDYSEYEYRYLNLVQGNHTGFLLFIFEVIFKNIGFSFQLFRTLELFLALLLISSTIKFYTKNALFPFLLFLIYPFLLDVVQVGNFLSYSIILFALRFLEQKTFKGAVKYIVFVLIASQFHILAIAYLLFLLSYIKRCKTVVILSSIISIILVASIQSLPLYIKYIPLIKSRSTQIEYYLTYNQGFVNGAITYTILLIACLLASYYKFYIIKKSHNYLINGRISETTLKILTLVICFVPFILINSEFVRLIRNMWIIFYIILFSDIKSIFGKKHSFNSVFKFVSLFLAIFLFYKELAPNAYYYETVTKCVLENNVFWKLFL